MSVASPGDDGVDAALVDQAILDFDAALADNPNADVEAFLPVGPNRLPALVGMIAAALDRARLRQSAGDIPTDRAASPACIEYYLVRYHRELLDHPQALVALLDHDRSSRAATEFPDFQVEAEIGRGNFSIVYRARQLSVNRIVALKVLLDGAYTRTENVARLRLEARILGRLDHPNIVKIYTVGESAGKPYLALEFCSGETLQTRLEKQALLPRVAASLLATLARAIHAAHECSILHRDLTPANVFFMEDGTPRVGDFGLSRLADAPANLTPHVAAIGTPAYAAPELTGLLGPNAPPVTERADIFSLGGILYHCLTRQPPFPGKGAVDVALAVVNDDPVPPRRIAPEVPRDMEAICLKCLSKAPGERYESALALAEDLERFLIDKPTLARPVTWPQQVVRWGRRNPWAVAVMGVLTLLLGVVAFLYAQSESHRQQAQKSHEAVLAQVQAQRRILREYALRVFDTRLFKPDQSRSVQCEILAQIWQHYETMQGQTPADVDLLLSRSELCVGLISLYHGQGKVEECLVWIDRCADLVQHPLLANLADPAHQLRLADILRDLLVPHVRVRFPRLVSQWGRWALALREPAIRQGDLKARLANHQTRRNFGCLLLHQCYHAEAAELLQVDQGYLRQLTNGEVPVPPGGDLADIRQEYLQNISLLAEGYLLVNERSNAVECWREICRHGSRYLDEMPEMPHRQIAVIRALSRLTDHERADLEIPPLLELLEQCKRTLSNWRKLDPENCAIENWFAEVHEISADIHVKSNQPELALADFREAIIMLESRHLQHGADYLTRFRLLDTRARLARLAYELKNHQLVQQVAAQTAEEALSLLREGREEHAVHLWGRTGSGNLITALRHAHCYEQAVAVNLEVRALFLNQVGKQSNDLLAYQGLSEAWTQLGKTHWAQENHEQTEYALTQAVAVARELHHRFAEQRGVLDDRLRRLGRFFEEQAKYPALMDCLDERADLAAQDATLARWLARDYQKLVRELPDEFQALREHCAREAARLGAAP